MICYNNIYIFRIKSGLNMKPCHIQTCVDMIWHVFSNYSSPRSYIHLYMYLKLTYFFDPICLHSLILRFKKNESKKKSSNQGSDCMSHQWNHIVKIESVDKFLFILKKTENKTSSKCNCEKKEIKSGPAFLSTSLLGFWRSVICCICQKFKCFQLLGSLPKWESGLAGLQLCSWQKIFSFSRPA